MVEMCETPETADETKSCLPISARLDLMLRESFNLVASNRAAQGDGGGGSGNWQLNIDRTCADFQSQMSAALSSFLMSPASECGPIPSVAASDRVAGETHAWKILIFFSFYFFLKSIFTHFIIHYRLFFCYLLSWFLRTFRKGLQACYTVGSIANTRIAGR